MTPKGRGPFVRRTEIAGLMNAIRAGATRPGLDRRTDCLIVNVTGSLPEFSVLKIDDVMVSPSDGEEEYRANPTFRGVAVDTPGETRIAILQEPAPGNGLALAVYAGVTLARLVGPTGGRFADSRAGSRTLHAADTGVCVILVDPGPPDPEEGEEETDERLAIVRIDGGGRAGSPAPTPGGGFPIGTSSCECSDCYKGSAKHKCSKCGCLNRRRYIALPKLWDTIPVFVIVKYTGEGCVYESLPFNGKVCCNRIRQYFVRVDYQEGRAWLMVYGDAEEEGAECEECVGPCEFVSASTGGDEWEWVPADGNTCSCECTPPEEPPTGPDQEVSGTCEGEPEKCPLVYLEWCLTDACGGGRRCTCPWIFQLDIHEGVDPPASCKLCVTPGQPRRRPSPISPIVLCGDDECIIELGKESSLRIEGVYEAFGSEEGGYQEYFADQWPLDDDHVASGTCCLGEDWETCKQWGYIEGVQTLDAYDVTRPDLGELAFDRWLGAWNIGACIASQGDDTYTVFAFLYASSTVYPNGSEPGLIQGSTCLLAWKSTSLDCKGLKEAVERGYVDLESLCNQSGGPPPTLPNGSARFYFNGEVIEQPKDQTSGHPGSACGGEDDPADCEDSVCALEVIDLVGESNPDDYTWAVTEDSDCGEDCGYCYAFCGGIVDNVCGDARDQVPGFRCEKPCQPDPQPDEDTVTVDLSHQGSGSCACGTQFVLLCLNTETGFYEGLAHLCGETFLMRYYESGGTWHLDGGPVNATSSDPAGPFFVAGPSDLGACDGLVGMVS